LVKSKEIGENPMELAIDEGRREVMAAEITFGARLRTPEELAEIVSEFAASGEWVDRVRLRVDERWYERLHQGEDYDIWVISWMPGQATGFHDHGESAGAFVVATGMLEEHIPGERPHVIQPGERRAFGAQYAHDVRNESFAPAISIHAYSPPLSEMNEYELDGGELVPREDASERVAALNEARRVPTPKIATRAGSSSIEQTLSAARARLRRLSPAEVVEALGEGEAVLVDIRPESQRATEGSIPGALIIERNVLEWRFDPTSSARLHITNKDLQVIVFCSEGYTSSLAAVALQDLGLWRATDLIGGYLAWSLAGLSTDHPDTM
jgi:rhodanese-related sulfurtransferase/mannose-6-phosphate isomerase-like protein (cupin superfamily)